MNVLPPTPDGIHRAADALRRGEIVAYPTETVYGLGVDPFNDEALRRLFELKGRDASNPALLIVAGRDQLDDLIDEFSPSAAAYAEAFWPGPLSMLFPSAKIVSPLLCGAQGKVCIRWTSNRIAADLCYAFGAGIVSTSANRSGAPPARSPDSVPAEGVTLCLDGGALPPGPPSTVLDPGTGAVLREGAISRARIQAVMTA